MAFGVRKSARALAAALVTALFIGWGCYLLGDPLAAAPWQNWQASAFLLPALLLVVSHALRALRLAAEFRGELGWVAAWQLLSWHTFLVNLLPLRSGELALPLLLNRQHQIPLLRAAATLIWLRTQDLLVLVALAALLWPGLSPPWRAVLLMLLPTVVLLLPLALRLAEPIPWPPVQRLAAALALAIAQTRFVWHWTIANWCVKIAAVALLFAQLLPESPPVPVSLFAALTGELGAIQPVQGVAGIGPYEAAAAAALASATLPLAQGVTVAVAAHALLLAISALMALLAWLYRGFATRA